MPVDPSGRPVRGAPPSPLLLSVIVPTCGRPDAIVRLLRGLAQQTLPADRFEVLVTDDGTDPPVAPELARLGLPYRLECEWQPQRGPSAARNRAIAKARAPYLLILNDDAGVPPDLLERHLAAQQNSPTARAWLGGFDFAPDCQSPFVVAATKLNLIFPFDLMWRSGPNPGRFFWTCNLSVPRQVVLNLGGFDESFDRPMCEDVELGYRLEKQGVHVWFLDGATCLHHHRVDVGWFTRRQIELGVFQVRTWRKHHDVENFPWIRQAPDEAALAAAFERGATQHAPLIDVLAREIDGLDDVAAVVPRLVRLNQEALRVGLLAGLKGWSTAQARAWVAALSKASAGNGAGTPSTRDRVIRAQAPAAC